GAAPLARQRRVGLSSVMVRKYDAVLLDLDGTLVDDEDRIHPRTLAALRTAAKQGVRVMVATGRSELATEPVLRALDIDMPAIVFNGAALWCSKTGRFLEERVLSERTLGRVLDYGSSHGLLTVVMCAGKKFALAPRNEVERLALHDMTGLEYSEASALRRHRAIRVTLFSATQPTSDTFAADVQRAIDQPVYLTHFPLNLLAHHRESNLLVVDLHPPCRGKGEALRVLAERYDVAPERVVAIGDAANDLDMFSRAGLSVAMENSMPEASAAASRIIGRNDSDTIGALVEELFLA
ncbi:MAG TPA: HAD family hydrolase, partial [Planctomycetota bacterium]|nr:HAD family hydrolase [Planctomycetota bacterium]